MVTSPTASTDKHWYLVYSKPRQEGVAKTNLERQGYQSYLPMVRVPRRRLGRRVIRIEPMFPRYLFIRLDTATDNWAPIRSTMGVSSLVRFGMHPSPVPDELVDFLRSRDTSAGYQDVPLNRLEPGQKVVIEEGPFRGYEGIYMAKSSHERVIVLLDIVGRSARAQVNIEHLGPVED